jgi:hypothetical protein
MTDCALSAPALDAPLSESEGTWHDERFGTVRQLLVHIQTETNLHTIWPTHELFTEYARSALREVAPVRLVNALESVYDDSASESLDQALALGYALARTSRARANGVDAWYAAALDDAGIRLLSDVESEIAHGRLDAFSRREAWRRGGRVDDDRSPHRPSLRKRALAIVRWLADWLQQDEEPAAE